MCELEWNEALWTMPLTSGAGVSMPAFEPPDIIRCEKKLVKTF